MTPINPHYSTQKMSMTLIPMRQEVERGTVLPLFEVSASLKAVWGAGCGTKKDF